MGGRYLLQPLLETTICHIMCSLNCCDHPPLKVCYNKGLRVTWAEFESCLIYVQPGSSSLTSPISNQFRSKWGIWTPTAEDVVTPFWVKGLLCNIPLLLKTAIPSLPHTSPGRLGFSCHVYTNTPLWLLLPHAQSISFFPPGNLGLGFRELWLTLGIRLSGLSPEPSLSERDNLY